VAEPRSTTNVSSGEAAQPSRRTALHPRSVDTNQDNEWTGNQQYANNSWEKTMKVDDHSLINEFPSFREKIHSLKMSSSHFHKLFDEYHTVDKEVHLLEADDSPVADEYMEQLKKRRLHLKDELYAMLQRK